jgi:hypothetical protein
MTGHSGTRGLPANPHLGHLRRQAKSRLAAMQTQNPQTQLAQAQLALARDYGFASWRAMVAEAMRRRTLFQLSAVTSVPAAPGQRWWRVSRHELTPDDEEGLYPDMLGTAAAAHIGLLFAALAGILMLLLAPALA